MRPLARLLIGLLAAVCALYAAPAAAQGIGGAGEHVQWTATTAPEAVRPGGTARLTLRAAIDDGWKMYALDSPPPSRGVAVRLDSLPAALAAGAATQAAPQEGYDPNFEKTVTYFEGAAALHVPLRVSEEAEAGPRTVSGEVEYMICTDELCLPPTREAFTAPVNVQPDGGTAAATGEAPEEGASVSAAADLGTATEGGLWGFLLLAAGAGVAALLTPCVFPMIPLTVSYFTKHTGTRAEAARMAGVYGLTIIGTFTGLGVLAALVLGASGAQSIAANPWVNLFIGLVFVFFALSLLGLFELRLPSGLLNYFNRQSSERAGYAGVLFMGLTLTLVSFSCTAPFVGTLLAATAGGAWSWPIVGMLTFSAVFALPFIGFALFPRGLGALPQSGSWMSAVKVVLGFVELAAALKFLSNADLLWGWGLLSRPLAIALTVVIFFLAGLYLLGTIRLAHEPAAEAIGSGRLLAAIAFFGVALYMVPGLLGAPLGTLDAYLPPRMADDVGLRAVQSGGPGEEAASEFDWITNDIDAAFAEAERQGQPVFIDFTGYTCTNCRDMEANVFPQPAIAERFRRDFVLLRLYTDDPQAGPALQRYQLRLTGTTALPTYAIVRPEGRRLVGRISGLTRAERFAAFLDEGAASSAERGLAAR